MVRKDFSEVRRGHHGRGIGRGERRGLRAVVDQIQQRCSTDPYFIELKYVVPKMGPE